MSRPPPVLGRGSARKNGNMSFLITSICKNVNTVNKFLQMDIKFTDNSKEILAAMQKAAVRALEKCGKGGSVGQNS